MTDAESLLLRHGALLRGHFLLSSGLHSDTYLQCAVALQYPETAEALGRDLADRIGSTLDEPPQVVVSPAMGGLIIGHEVGRALGVRACFTERADGQMCLRRGFALEAEERVLLVEDVVTTGLSSRETLAVIRAHGGTPVAAACVADRSGNEDLDGLPLVAALRLRVPAWEPADCPLCAEGRPVVKPGSRAPAV